MVLLWLMAIGGFVLAIAALAVARRTARKLSDVTGMYWQLKYDYGELKARVDPPAPSVPEPRQTFVPLSSIKKG